MSVQVGDAEGWLNQVIVEATKRKLDRIVIGKKSLCGAYGCCDKSWAQWVAQSLHPDSVMFSLVVKKKKKTRKRHRERERERDTERERRTEGQGEKQGQETETEDRD